MINDNYLDKLSKTYTITDEGMEDYELLLKSLNHYVLAILEMYLSEFPECRYLREYAQRCQRFDMSFYKHAIMRFDSLDSYLVNLAKTTTRKEEISQEKALANMCYGIEDILDKPIRELCGK